MYNILICDDDQDIINALKIFLSDSSYNLFEANNGKQALEVISGEDIHLVLMDIMMPEMDGISAMVRIRESSNVPIILITAKSESEDKILGLNVGADDYVTKPFNPIEVAARVKSQIRRYTQLGAAVVTEDSLNLNVAPFRVNVLNQWTYHARLYSAAQYVAECGDPGVNLVQLVSFGCGVDAITTD